MRSSWAVAIGLLCVGLVWERVAAAEPEEREWAAWTAARHERYDPTDRQLRFENFKRNYHYIRNANTPFKVGLNKWADLAATEWKSSLGQQLPSPRPVFPQDTSLCKGRTPPQSIQWKQVTPVVDQGISSHVTLIVTTESIEDNVAIKTGKLVLTSQQELLDCVGPEHMAADYFQWIATHGGIDSDSSYPWTGIPAACKPTPDVVAKLSGFGTVTNGNETELACAVAFTGPTTICIDASHSSFQFYESGIYYEPDCSSTNVDHCMVITGYGSIGGKDYWIAENSWGADWGENGYVYLSRNRKNNCGVASFAAVPYVRA